MRAVIDSAIELLPDDLQLLFFRLSAFSGGWTLDAAAEVGGTGLESGRGWNASASATGATCFIGVGVDTVIGSVHTGDGHVVCQ